MSWNIVHLSHRLQWCHSHHAEIICKPTKIPNNNNTWVFFAMGLQLFVCVPLFLKEGNRCTHTNTVPRNGLGFFKPYFLSHTHTMEAEELFCSNGYIFPKSYQRPYDMKLDKGWCHCRPAGLTMLHKDSECHCSCFTHNREIKTGIF